MNIETPFLNPRSGERHRGQVFILDRFICFFNLTTFFFSFLSFSVFWDTRLQACDTPDSPMPKCRPSSFGENKIFSPKLFSEKGDIIDWFELVRLDWSDLLMAAGFGDDIHAHEKWKEKVLNLSVA